MFSIAEKHNFIKNEFFDKIWKEISYQEMPRKCSYSSTRVFSYFDRYKNSGTEHDNPNTHPQKSYSFHSSIIDLCMSCMLPNI